jgi:hypothetical protein
MKILLGSIHVGESKKYAWPRFTEMLDKVFPDIDVALVTDNPALIQSIPSKRFTGLRYDHPASNWATEICYYAKRKLGQYALECGYDALVWQGLDCYYSNRGEFDALVEVAEHGHDIVGALIAGRDMPDYPVCRKFVVEDGKITTREEELQPEIFASREPIRVRGYIGSDATIISRRALETVDMSTYEHWHDRMARGEYTIGPDEWFMRSALKIGMTPISHTGVRPWHLHESMSAVRLFGERQQW